MSAGTTVDNFLSWARKPGPRFVRTPSSKTSWRASLPSVIPLQHVLGPRPGPEELARLRRTLRAASPALEALYALHDGAHLFACDDPENDDAGLHFCPISEMDDEKSNVEEWFEDVNEGSEPIVDKAGRPEFYSLPRWYEKALVFGRFGHAAERLLLACTGPYEGRVIR